MNITPNYNVNFFRFNQKVNNDNGQTQPQELTQPTFKMNNKTIMTGAAALGATVIGGIKAAENLNAKNETQIPTRKEFEKRLGRSSDAKYWLEAYDTDPEQTIKLRKFCKDHKIIIMSPLNGDGKFEKWCKNLDSMKLVLEAEDEIGTRPFSSQFLAESIVDKSADYPNGLKTMLNLRTENGDFRFKDDLDYCAAEVFEKYPDMALEYAEARDDIGNYRFSGSAIKEIIETKTGGTYPPEKVDEILNLRRPDGSYVHYTREDTYRGFRLQDVIDDFISSPIEYAELCSLRVGGEKGYISGGSIGGVIESYKDVPEETKRILRQMPRFGTYDIARNDAAYIMSLAPKSFQTLARIRNVEGDFAYGIKEIEKIINKYALYSEEKNPEKTKEILKMFNVLANIKYLDWFNSWSGFDFKQILKVAEIYQKYPQETVDIIKKRGSIKTQPWNVEKIIPTEEDIKLYIENREEFDKKEAEKLDKLNLTEEEDDDE